jgi:hypothetical protein
VLVALAAGAPAQAQGCADQDKVKVPGAEMQRLACLPDMTTTGTAASDYTDASDWSSLHPQMQPKPSGVPGLQVDGYFPDTSTANTTHGWAHDSQFVIRLPDRWDGKLIVVGAPGVRKQYAHDVEVGDHAIARGYAYAATDKGNGGNSFYNDGVEPGDAGVEWNTRVTELAVDLAFDRCIHLAIPYVQHKSADQLGIYTLDQLDLLLITVRTHEFFKISACLCIERGCSNNCSLANAFVFVIGIVKFTRYGSKDRFPVLTRDDLEKRHREAVDLSREDPFQHFQLLIVFNDRILKQEFQLTTLRNDVTEEKHIAMHFIQCLPLNCQIKQ